MYVQAGLTYLCSFNAVHLWCLAFSLFVCKEQKSAYDIADAAESSFLAVTRNLMIMVCRMCLWFVVGIVLSLGWGPWSWPGMTVSRALLVFSGCLLVFRQKNKSFPLNIPMCIQASLMLFWYFNAVHLWCLAFSLFVCKEQKGFMILHM